MGRGPTSGGGNDNDGDQDEQDDDTDFQDREPETVQSTLDEWQGGADTIGGKVQTFAEVGNPNADDGAASEATTVDDNEGGSEGAEAEGEGEADESEQDGQDGGNVQQEEDGEGDSGGDEQASDPDSDTEDEEATTGTVGVFEGGETAVRTFMGFSAITASPALSQDADEEAIEEVGQTLYEQAKEELEEKNLT